MTEISESSTLETNKIEENTTIPPPPSTTTTTTTTNTSNTNTDNEKNKVEDEEMIKKLESEKKKKEKRQKRAEIRRRNVLARENKGLKYIQNQVSKEELRQTVEKNLHKSSEELQNLQCDDEDDDGDNEGRRSGNISNTNTNTNTTLPNNNSNNDNNNNYNNYNNIPPYLNDELIRKLSPLSTSLSSLSSLSSNSPTMNDPTAQIFANMLSQFQQNGSINNHHHNNNNNNNMFDGIDDATAYSSLFNNTDNIENDKKLKEWKQKEQRLNHTEEWLHTILVVFLVLGLFCIPNINIWSYNLSSDTWSFFLAFECILFGIMSWYRGRLDSIKPKESSGFEQLAVLAQLMGMEANQTQKLFGRFQKFLTIMADATKIMRQFGSDLALMTFLWVGSAAVHSWLFS